MRALIRAIWAAIARFVDKHIVAEGYEDATGFHRGVQRKGGK
jgi:hypothetical protein